MNEKRDRTGASIGEKCCRSLVTRQQKDLECPWMRVKQCCVSWWHERKQVPLALGGQAQVQRHPCVAVGWETWPFTRSNCFPTPGGPCGRLEAARHGPPPAVRGTVGIQGGRAWFTINSIDARSADSKAVAYQRMSSSRIFSRLLLCHQLTVQRLLNEM